MFTEAENNAELRPALSFGLSFSIVNIAVSSETNMFRMSVWRGVDETASFSLKTNSHFRASRDNQFEMWVILVF